ncbi:hypothetical protein [Candidatus Hecatella orcuttiae]|jgi:hypothetical protein|uniref:hypothetical protein n=1 Tax=Candidatus Hecatella orcuttiae TaxID=1935119 RepID=UPI002867CB22|nr:hypothetical protein [Candidatus Hecatella orcuttiae]
MKGKIYRDYQPSRLEAWLEKAAERAKQEGGSLKIRVGPEELPPEDFSYRYFTEWVREG